MLVVDISINRYKYIKSIFIHRIETADDGNHTYRIEKPEGFEDKLIKHQYEDGALILLKKALDIIVGDEQ